jgi:hypothetical protein
MATERSRSYLVDKFQDGDRPTGGEFADLIESFINKADDKISLDATENVIIPAGLTLATATTGDDGTLRFNSGTGIVEVFVGGSWEPVSGGGGGGFSEVNGGPNVAFSAGNVGIGTGVTTPVNKLEVPLAANTGPAQRIKLGNAIIHNGAANTAAFFAHHSKTDDLHCALKQDGAGNTTLSSPPGNQIAIAQGGVTRFLLGTTGPGSLQIAVATTSITGSASINGTLLVTGNVTTNGDFVDNSDAMVKEDVKALNWGLKDLLKLDPVSFRYNGIGGTPTDGIERIGLIAQNVEAVFPSLVQKVKTEDPDAEYILGYKSHSLMFVMINAIRELNDRVEKLESQLFGDSNKE